MIYAVIIFGMLMLWDIADETIKAIKEIKKNEKED